jgi:hypothetical protein
LYSSIAPFQAPYCEVVLSVAVDVTVFCSHETAMPVRSKLIGFPVLIGMPREFG